MTDWIAWDAIEGALTKTKQILFEPFDLTKYIMPFWEPITEPVPEPA
ncbi:MAG: hypothetical protein U9N09_02565 [Euryarchaeota archaeon]|nr:hypothetical protein [Euryarchaeota archaeon]